LSDLYTTRLSCQNKNPIEMYALSILQLLNVNGQKLSYLLEFYPTGQDTATLSKHKNKGTIHCRGVHICFVAFSCRNILNQPCTNKIGNFSQHMSAKSLSKISPNHAEVISEVFKMPPFTSIS
jgi:hypothetical protein